MFNVNDVLGGLKGDNTSDNESGNESESGGLAGLMDMAKDFSAEDLEHYKSMSKMELMNEVKNSEHSATVIEFLKGLLAKKD